MRELVLGARLTLAGGRTGLLRTLIAAVGVGLGVAVLLIAASLPTIHGERQSRSKARDAVALDRTGIQAAYRGLAPVYDLDPKGGATLLVGDVGTEFRGAIISGRLLEPEGADAPVPPGLTRLPQPGELFVSPALADLLATPDGRALLAPRLGGRVVGEIGREGLLGPSELGFYAGARDLVEGGPVRRIDHWQLAVRRLQLDPGGAARAVSGITVAVAGAIALQMVFTGARAEFEARTGADPSRAELYVSLDKPRITAGELATGIASAPGARLAAAVTEYEGAGGPTVYVASCATLRELATIRDCAERRRLRDPRRARARPRGRSRPPPHRRRPARSRGHHARRRVRDARRGARRRARASRSCGGPCVPRGCARVDSGDERAVAGARRHGHDRRARDGT